MTAYAKKKTAPFIGPEKLERYVRFFNDNDEETVRQAIPNEQAAAFLRQQIPRFSCPDKQLEQTYYFRFWTLRKHIEKTEDGFVISEFLPKVYWSGKHNTIICAAGHQLAEARWLKDTRIAEDYLRFWYGAGQAGAHDYVSWLPHAALELCRVSGDRTVLADLFPAMVKDHLLWDEPVEVFGGEHITRDECGLYHSFDFFDGGELSIGGHGYRPLFNSAQCANAAAIAQIAGMLGHPAEQQLFAERAERLRRAIGEQLWDDSLHFFTVHDRQGRSRGVRELYGYAPWFFGLIGDEHAEAFDKLFDPQGFAAPYGLTFAEQSHPQFTLSYEGHECQWNGPIWPYACSIALGAVERLLDGGTQSRVPPERYLSLLHTYAAAHQRVTADGRVIPWIDEDLHPYSGDWISRTCLERMGWPEGKGGYERGKDYDHSLFCDHVIRGLVGVHPTLSGTVRIRPLVSPKQWDSFCLEDVHCQGHRLTVVWDADGRIYGAPPGLSVYVDDCLIENRAQIEPITVDLRR